MDIAVASRLPRNRIGTAVIVAVIWTAEHAIAVVRQLRAGATADVKIFTRLGDGSRVGELEQARGALLQAECCLTEAARLLAPSQHPKSKIQNP